ncbi:MAG: hypothetical protein ACJ762_08545 [Solirubrobacteraceae bacterium]
MTVRRATLDDEVVGFLSADRSRDEDAPPHTREIWALYVARYRRAL